MVLMGMVMAVSTKVEFADVLQVGVIKEKDSQMAIEFLS